ncbi:protein of unknown function [Ralstonia solanacearum CFBP2957]|nr:protein of unknown function [Ralstonia solanacearum CFBP2957]
MRLVNEGASVRSTALVIQVSRSAIVTYLIRGP